LSIDAVTNDEKIQLWAEKGEGGSAGRKGGEVGA